MPLSLKEKEKVMRSLHEKINMRITEITQEHPTYEHEVLQEARGRAHAVHKVKQKVSKFEKAMEKLWKAKNEAEDLYCELIGEVAGKSSEEIRKDSSGGYYGNRKESHISLRTLEGFKDHIESLAEKSMQHHLDQTMMKSPIGKELKMLRDQKKYVDDAVMLATTNTKLYPIYEQVLSAIGAKETPLLAAGMNSNGREPQLTKGKSK